jgi:GTP-binding protein EngB required for normal cell division
MKLKPFKDIIAMSKEKLNEALAPIRARKVKTQAEMKKSEIDEKIVIIETEIQEMCSEKEINFDTLFEKLDKIALLERRKKQYDKVLGELFPEDCKCDD